MGNRAISTGTVDFETMVAADDGSNHPELHAQGRGALDCGAKDAVGIQGRAGTSIDALGLICGDRVNFGTDTSTGASQLAVRSFEEAAICKQGFVWREAVAGDKVCVAPVTRAKNQRLNSIARFRSSTGVTGGTCIKGFVWREAMASDQTCVTPEDRAETRHDNAMAAQRRIGP